MSDVKIDRALEVAAVAALGATFTGKTAFEGLPFTPPQTGPWAQLFNLRAGASVASLGVNGMDEHVGVYQIDVSVPEVGGNPRATLLGYADTLRAYFVAGRPFTHAGQTVRVVRSDASQIRRVDGWQRVSVSVTYSAMSTRPAI